MIGPDATFQQPPPRGTSSLQRRLTFIHFALFNIAILVTIFFAWQNLYILPNSDDPVEASKSPVTQLSEIVIKSIIPLTVIDVISWLLIRRTFRPVQNLISAAEKLTTENLHAPLPVTGSGDEVDRLAWVLNNLTSRLAESFERIRGFTLHASHELKTPLTILHTGFERALLNPQLSEEEREQLLSWQDETLRLNRIVSGLSLLTRADAQQVVLQPEPVELGSLLQDLAEDTAALGQAADLKVTCSIPQPVTVFADRHRLRQLFLNLADNAVKYNEPGGSVRISLSRSARDAIVEITNSGPGIPPESLPSIFERFYRGPENQSRRIDGSGLGLSIARWIADAHHGSLSAQSDHNLTTLTLRLPLAPEKATTAASPHAAHPSQASATAPAIPRH
jgi:signal transduction histidine kinase